LTLIFASLEDSSRLMRSKIPMPAQGYILSMDKT